jgi:hypothetical protein
VAFSFRVGWAPRATRRTRNILTLVEVIDSVWGGGGTRLIADPQVRSARIPATDPPVSRDTLRQARSSRPGETQVASWPRGMPSEPDPALDCSAHVRSEAGVRDQRFYRCGQGRHGDEMLKARVRLNDSDCRPDVAETLRKSQSRDC